MGIIKKKDAHGPRRSLQQKCLSINKPKQSLHQKKFFQRVITTHFGSGELELYLQSVSYV